MSGIVSVLVPRAGNNNVLVSTCCSCTLLHTDMQLKAPS